MDRHHKDDIWLKRSPVHPGVTAVRHGDYTSQELLHDSLFYKNVLKPIKAEYGASVVAWRDNTWLATLTVMHSAKQGEFTAEQMDELRALHPHFECVIRRMAGHQESKHIYSSLGRFIADLPTASLILDWNLRPIHFSALAAQLCTQWRHGSRSPFFKTPRGIQVPGDILSAIETLRPAISQTKAPKKGGARVPLRAIHPHGQNTGLTASIEFLPSRGLALNKGTFLVTLNEESASGHGDGISSKMGSLSPRERECAFLAAEGLQNNEIARRLGKSPITVRNQLTSIFDKLGLDSRHKLIAAFAQLDAATRKKLRLKKRPVA